MDVGLEGHQDRSIVNKATNVKHLSKNPMVPWKRLVDLNLALMSKADQSTHSQAMCSEKKHFGYDIDECNLTLYTYGSSFEPECSLTSYNAISMSEPLSQQNLNELVNFDERNDELINSHECREMRSTSEGTLGSASNDHEADDCQDDFDLKKVGKLNSEQICRCIIGDSIDTKLLKKQQWPSTIPPDPQRHYTLDTSSDDGTSDPAKNLTEVNSDQLSDLSCGKPAFDNEIDDVVNQNDSKIDDSGFGTRDITTLSFRSSAGADTDTDYESDWDENDENFIQDDIELLRNIKFNHKHQNVLTDSDSQTSRLSETRENQEQFLQMNIPSEGMLENRTNAPKHILSTLPCLAENLVSSPHNENDFHISKKYVSNKTNLDVIRFDEFNQKMAETSNEDMFPANRLSIINPFLDTAIVNCAECSNHLDALKSISSDGLVSPKQFDSLEEIQQNEDRPGVAIISKDSLIKDTSSDVCNQWQNSETLSDKYGLADLKKQVFHSITLNDDANALVQQESNNFQFINTSDEDESAINICANKERTQIHNKQSTESFNQHKFLTRNPLTSWKRFVDVNIESLNLTNYANQASQVIPKCRSDRIEDPTTESIGSHRRKDVLTNWDSMIFCDSSYSGIFNKCISHEGPETARLGAKGEKEEINCDSLVIDDLRFDEVGSFHDFNNDRIQQVFSRNKDLTPKGDERFCESLVLETHSHQNQENDNYLAHDNILCKQTESNEAIDYAVKVVNAPPKQSCIDCLQNKDDNEYLYCTDILHNIPSKDFGPKPTSVFQSKSEEPYYTVDTITNRQYKMTGTHPSNILLKAAVDNHSIQILHMPDNIQNCDDIYSGFIDRSSKCLVTDENRVSKVRNKGKIRSKHIPQTHKDRQPQIRKIQSRLCQEKYNGNEREKKNLQEIGLVDFSSTGKEVNAKNSSDILGIGWSKLTDYIYKIFSIFNFRLQKSGDNEQESNSEMLTRHKTDVPSKISTNTHRDSYIQETNHKRTEHFNQYWREFKSMHNNEDYFIIERDLHKAIDSHDRILKSAKRRKRDSNPTTLLSLTTDSTNDYMQRISSECHLDLNVSEKPCQSVWLQNSPIKTYQKDIEKRPTFTFSASHQKSIKASRNSKLHAFSDKPKSWDFISDHDRAIVVSTEFRVPSPDSRVKFYNFAQERIAEKTIDTTKAANENELSDFLGSNSHQQMLPSAEVGLRCKQGRAAHTLTVSENTTSAISPKASSVRLSLLTQTLPAALMSMQDVNVFSEREELCSKQKRADVSNEDGVEMVVADDMLKSSLECLLEMLLQRGKVSQAFVGTVQGHIVAKTSGLFVTERDVMALVCCLTSNYQGMTRVTVLASAYQCFKLDRSSTLVGKSDDSILVALRGKQTIVVGFANPSSPGSCIREIQELAQALSHRGL